MKHQPVTPENEIALPLTHHQSVSVEGTMAAPEISQRTDGLAIQSLQERIHARSAEVGIMGLGYVGLTEAMAFAKADLQVTGFDIDSGRIQNIQEGRSYLVDISGEELSRAVQKGKLRATSDFSRLKEMDVILISVPTPLSKTKAPDLSYIVSAVEAIRLRLREGQLIILESTTYPGTTMEVVLPALEAAGLKAGSDFHLCFSPERINPGDHEYSPRNIPRIVGGVTRPCAEVAAEFYGLVSPKVVTVSSPEAAEMVKLLENTFRAVNIGLVNEIALMCRSLGVDVWEIIDAAATKPFGFMPFYPGPGLGGHCIPIDPLYLSWKARVNGFEPRFIDLATQVNNAMPRFVVSTVVEVLNQRGRSVNGSTIVLLGVSYKRDVNDARESPAIEIMSELWKRGAKVTYHDPYVPRLEVEGRAIRSIPLDHESIKVANCVVIVTDHRCIDYAQIVEHAAAVIDTRNATREVTRYREKIIKL
jgi:UDP-N-acetyl-D-glucosamine dehydrogenase